MEPQNEDYFSPKEKDGQNKGKINRELHNLESYIKQGKYPSEICKSNLVNLSKSRIFERCKIYKEVIFLKECLVQEEKPSILIRIFNLY